MSEKPTTCANSACPVPAAEREFFYVAKRDHWYRHCKVCFAQLRRERRAAKRHDEPLDVDDDTDHGVAPLDVAEADLFGRAAVTREEFNAAVWLCRERLGFAHPDEPMPLITRRYLTAQRQSRQDHSPSPEQRDPHVA